MNTMKKVIIALLLLYLNPFTATSQTYDQQLGLFTIPNMSTSFVRMPSRETSQEVDAVYSNPAGLISLDNGLHFQVNNQFQWVRKSTTTHYKEFNNGSNTYDLNIDNYIFPTIYVVWKKNNFVFSGAIFAAMGGGGGSNLPNLPSAELGIADMNAAISTLTKLYEKAYPLSQKYSNTDYQYNFTSEGFAFSPGVQIGATYQINPQFSVYGGLRHIRYFGVAEGGASDIVIKNNETGETFDPIAYLDHLYATEQQVIDAQPLISIGDLELNGGELLDAVSGLIGELFVTGDTDVKQNGIGFTPIFGVQYNHQDKIYVAFKYEHKTKVELLTEVFDEKDGDGRYTDGTKIRADLPAISSLGIRYNVNDNLKLAFGNRVAYFKGADANGREKLIDRNHLEFTGSAEYYITKQIAISGGYTYSNFKVEDAYQSEIDFAMPGHSIAVGAQYKFSDFLMIEAGWLNTFYIPTTYQKEYQTFQGKLNLPDALNQKIKNDIEGRVMLVSIGATLSLPGASN
jgi:long-chain fatty acid transport protein